MPPDSTLSRIFFPSSFNLPSAASCPNRHLRSGGTASLLQQEQNRGAVANSQVLLLSGAGGRHHQSGPILRRRYASAKYSSSFPVVFWLIFSFAEMFGIRFRQIINQTRRKIFILGFRNAIHQYSRYTTRRHYLKTRIIILSLSLENTFSLKVWSTERAAPAVATVRNLHLSISALLNFQIIFAAKWNFSVAVAQGGLSFVVVVFRSRSQTFYSSRNPEQTHIRSCASISRLNQDFCLYCDIITSVIMNTINGSGVLGRLRPSSRTSRCHWLRFFSGVWSRYGVYMHTETSIFIFLHTW